MAPLPDSRQAVAISAPTDSEVARLGRRLAATPIEGLTAVEYVDRAAARALGEALSRPARDQPLVLVEIEAPSSAEGRRRIGQVERLTGAGTRLPAPTVFADADELWTIRGESGDRLDRELGPRLREDVGVPLDRLAGLFTAIRRIGRRHRVAVYLYGHLGQGNLHPNFVVEPDSPLAGKIRRELLTEVHRLGGTISAEHGMGRAKSRYFGLEHDAASRRLWRRLKAECDPDGILNPGVLDPPGRASRARGP